jgi:hypothetical protein
MGAYEMLAGHQGTNLWVLVLANLNYVGIPLGQSFPDSLIFNVVKRTGRGPTMLRESTAMAAGSGTRMPCDGDS